MEKLENCTKQHGRPQIFPEADKTTMAAPKMLTFFCAEDKNRPGVYYGAPGARAKILGYFIGGQYVTSPFQIPGWGEVIPLRAPMKSSLHNYKTCG